MLGRRQPRITLFLNPQLLDEVNEFARGNRSQLMRDALYTHIKKLKKLKTPAA